MPLLNTPDIRQSGEYDCGRTAARIVLQTLGIPEADAVGMVGRLYTDKHDGTDPAQLAQWARHEGFGVAEGFHDLDTVRHHGNEGRPVILLANLHGGGHWTVSRGIARNKIYLQDPCGGRENMPLDEFAACWVDSNRYGARFRQWAVVLRV